MNKYRVGIIGATGMVGQRFVTLLAEHPWFDITALAASPRSAGRPYGQAVEGRWKMTQSLPESVAGLQVMSATDDIDTICDMVDLVFCAVDLDKQAIRELEESYAAKGVAVVSNNSAHRWTEDVPMIIPEVNAEHLKVIDAQRENRGWTSGCIVVKPNCSIQSYVTVLTALNRFAPAKAQVTSIQAVSGAGRTLDDWSEMQDNIIPYIGGEEEKSEREPLKIWGEPRNGVIVESSDLSISATCVRAPISDGHLACVAVDFATKPSFEQIREAVTQFNAESGVSDLPSAPSQAITLFEDDDRPQVREDREIGKGMGVSAGRFRDQGLFDWDFVSLAHNTLRGAAGGAVLTAELLVREGYVRR
jgi:aspartate-semialdehyde dehydrogenase